MQAILEQPTLTTTDPASTLTHAAQPATRVLHLINSFESGGTERQAVELLKRINRQRFDIRLAAIQRKGTLYDEIAAQYPTLLEFPLDSLYNKNAWEQVKALRAYLLREQIDILHAHDFYAGWLGAWATRFTSVQFIAAQRHLKLSDRLVHTVGRRLINGMAKRVICNAEMIRDYVLAQRSVRPAKLAAKLVVIRNGIEFDLPQAGSAEAQALREQLSDEFQLPYGAQIVGNIANLRTVKGHHYLIEAAAKVVREIPNAHFILIGEGALREQLEAQAKELRVHHNIHFLGRREHAARYNAAFDLAVLASLHEGMPNTVLEAMATGTAVVATAVGGVKEIINDFVSGYLVPPAQSTALAARIVLALSNDEERQRIAACGNEFVKQHFSMQRMVSETEQLYDTLHTR